MLKSRLVRLVELRDWNELVVATYGRPYNFQQQRGCMNRGTEELLVEGNYKGEDFFEQTEIPETTNTYEMGVTLEAWLSRDPKQRLSEEENSDWELEMWWERNFYPDIDFLAEDMANRGVLEPGTYVINIDW